MYIVLAGCILLYVCVDDGIQRSDLRSQDWRHIYDIAEYTQ